MTRPRRVFSMLAGPDARWNPEATPADLEGALLELFDGCAHDLRGMCERCNGTGRTPKGRRTCGACKGTREGEPCEDPRDPRFLDYAGDSMSWANVPDHIIDAALAWMKAGSKRGRLSW